MYICSLHTISDLFRVFGSRVLSYTVGSSDVPSVPVQRGMSAILIAAQLFGVNSSMLIDKVTLLNDYYY